MQASVCASASAQLAATQSRRAGDLTRLETRTEESGMCASGSNGNYVRSMKVKCTSIVQYTPT